MSDAPFSRVLAKVTDLLGMQLLSLSERLLVPSAYLLEQGLGGDEKQL
jgi:hypothetical protein